MAFLSRFDTLFSFYRNGYREISDWLRFLYLYTQKRVVWFVVRFEQGKDVLVDVLITKRGRYSKHFLNISFLFLVAGAIILGPAIGEYYPTLAHEPEATGTEATESATISLSEITTTTQESDKPRFEIIDYEVESGDTLGSISEKFGISIDTIRWANSLKIDTLVPGQKLRIPPVTGIVHKVAAGDTIYSLAKKYKSDAQVILNFPANDFTDLDTFALAIGQTLFIPQGVPPQAAPVYQPTAPQFIAGTGGKFQWPTQGTITQYPVSYHMAVDIASRELPPIAAGDGGVVSYAGCLKYGYGCHVIINHADGYQSLYGHMSSYSVSAGDKVGRGQVIGKMGSTGRSTGPHLHFEIRKNGALLNPLQFFK